MNSLAPIALFVFNRPSHTELTLKYLQQNPEARESDLVIFSDGPRLSEDAAKVKQVRSVISSVSGFRSLRLVARSDNHGLAGSVIAGVSDILQTRDRVIVLEDDMLTSPYFLHYMNTALDRYAPEERVGSVHAYMYPISGLPEFFFMRGADCWGWGTWRNRWTLLETDGRRLLRMLKARGVLAEFNHTGGDAMIRMLTDQIRRRNSSWFIRWHASLFLAGRLTLQPGRSFIQNIGFDASGTHCDASSAFAVTLRNEFPGLPSLDVVENREAVKQICVFFEKNGTGTPLKRIARSVIDEIQMRKIVWLG